MLVPPTKPPLEPLVELLEPELGTDVMLDRAEPFCAARSHTPVETSSSHPVSWMQRLSSFVNAGSVRRVSAEPQPSLYEK